MIHRFARLFGVLLFATWVWWAYQRASDLAIVSPVHWPLLLPQLVLEGIPATIAVATAASLVFTPKRSKLWACLLCVSVVQSVVIAIAVPGLEGEYKRTLDESRSTWQWIAPPAPSPTEQEEH